MNNLTTLKDIKRTIDFYVDEFGEYTNIEFIVFGETDSTKDVQAIIVKQAHSMTEPKIIFRIKENI